MLRLLYFWFSCFIIFKLAIKNKKHYENTNNTHMYDSDVFFDAMFSLVWSYKLKRYNSVIYIKNISDI